MKLHVTDREGGAHELDFDKGEVLMRVLRAEDLGIKAECDGCCACATCHVYVDPAWMAKVGKPNEEELDMLDEALEVEANSRLSCQVVLGPEHDGLKVVIAPDWD